MTHRSIAAALACALVAGTAAMPAHAATTARVAYADLDLGSAAGQRTLAHRLSAAATVVCPAHAADWSAQIDCRRTALDQARADLRRAGVTAF